jgi:hypothetical protein
MQELIKAADRDAHEETNEKATPALCVRLRGLRCFHASLSPGVWIHRTATKIASAVHHTSFLLCIIRHSWHHCIINY